MFTPVANGFPPGMAELGQYIPFRVAKSHQLRVWDVMAHMQSEDHPHLQFYLNYARYF